ncbi:sensor domain-containing protein [Streptomyces roseoverticillatus]|uniref:sensor histidine kinase n=1 Tax=Streptomyces roseoverticillatus TaxID=66429 RepID=UPI001F255082|nr:sensor histidine kinase [Streptomyces roseoverticillatus]MCF3104363.1 sensor domain-containing protein [Streptomyces roseoverticillatus]
MKKISKALLTAARGLWLAIFGMATSILLFVLTVLSIVFTVLGIGLFTTPVAVAALRAHASLRRRQAKAWACVEIPEPYRPLPARRPGLAGQVELCTALLKDPATWRDLLWLLVDATAGTVLALLAPALVLYLPWGAVLALGVWKPIDRAGGGLWFTFVHITDQFTANLAAALGVVWGVMGVLVALPLLRTDFLLAKLLLQPTRATLRERELARRVDRLTESRHDAVDSSAAELRRIERDLHDGAQARLVAMGMSLGTIEALIEKDPGRAKKLVAAARADSAEALTELRDLVRGIHPPVLAERGLGDALRALALRMPLPVEVDVELAGRAEEPVETAAYFAVSEVLTNAAKHSGARQVWLDVQHAEGMLRIAVTDDGRGGAGVPADGTAGARRPAGSGLAGIERRIGTLDGVLAVSSPVGGPTLVTMEIPCALH